MVAPLLMRVSRGLFTSFILAFLPISALAASAPGIDLVVVGGYFKEDGTLFEEFGRRQHRNVLRAKASALEKLCAQEDSSSSSMHCAVWAKVQARDSVLYLSQPGKQELQATLEKVGPGQLRSLTYIGHGNLRRLRLGVRQTQSPLTLRRLLKYVEHQSMFDDDALSGWDLFGSAPFAQALRNAARQDTVLRLFACQGGRITGPNLAAIAQVPQVYGAREGLYWAIVGPEGAYRTSSSAGVIRGARPGEQLAMRPHRAGIRNEAELLQAVPALYATPGELLVDDIAYAAYWDAMRGVELELRYENRARVAIRFSAAEREVLRMAWNATRHGLTRATLDASLQRAMETSDGRTVPGLIEKMQIMLSAAHWLVERELEKRNGVRIQSRHLVAVRFLLW